MITLDTGKIITAEDKAAQAKEADRVAARKYLLETDWYVARFAETGKEIPDDVLKARQEARVVADGDD